MTDTRSNARRSAMQALYQWQMTGDNTGSIEIQFLVDMKARQVKIDDFKELLHGIPTHIAIIDETLSEFIDRSLKSLDEVERVILRLGTYELLKRPQVPVRIIINEAINLAKTYGAEQSHKYINSVLDKVARKHRSQETKTSPATQIPSPTQPFIQTKKVKISVKSKAKPPKKIVLPSRQASTNKYGQSSPQSGSKYKETSRQNND